MMDRYTATNEPQGMTENGFATIAVLIAVLILAIAILSGDIELVKLGNKLLNIALVLAVAVLFPLYLLSRRNHVLPQIFSHPLALAVYVGLVVLGCGVAVAD